MRRSSPLADLAGALPPEQLAAVLAARATCRSAPSSRATGCASCCCRRDFSTDDLQEWLTFADDSARDRGPHRDAGRVGRDRPAGAARPGQLDHRRLLLVAIMLAVSYRRLRETLVALVPITLTVADAARLHRAVRDPAQSADGHRLEHRDRRRDRLLDPLRRGNQLCPAARATATCCGPSTAPAVPSWPTPSASRLP